MGAKIQIRPGAATELPALVEALGQRPFFADRLARQHQGRGVLLVAWLDDHPVGDVYLLREPADVPKVRLHLPGVPQLDHLEVMGPLQRRGIGTALIHAGEDTARRLGDEQLAPGVGLATSTLGGSMSGSGMSTGAMGQWWGPGGRLVMMGRRWPCRS
jgi:GNAT superfamily N-acetyltransferase